MSKAISQLKSLREQKNLIPFLYVISMAIAFTAWYGDYNSTDFFSRVLIRAVWIVVALVQLYIDISHKRNSEIEDLKWMIKLYFLPHVFIHLYSIFLMLIGKVSWSYFTTNIKTYGFALLAICSLYLFKEKAFKYISIALICSWVLSVSVSTITKGFQIFPQAVIQGYIDPNYKIPGFRANYFELHDLVLAAAYIVIFYFFAQKKLLKMDFAFLSFISLIIFLGIKRISIVGLILVTIFHIAIRWFSEKNQYKICLIAGWAGFIFCFFFIYWVSVSGKFTEFVNENEINAMGRTYFYETIMKHAQFSPSFMGVGRHVVSRILSEDLAHVGVLNVHSDIIKMYVENGFIVFGMWLWYYLINVTRQYKNRFGFKEAVFYFGLTIYTFTLYLTDNIEIYFICQMFSIITPMAYALRRRKKEELGGSIEDRH